jgi:hypothetical protein
MKGSGVGNTNLEEQPPEYGPQYEDHQLIDAVELHVVRQPPTMVTTYFCRTSSQVLLMTTLLVKRFPKRRTLHNSVNRGFLEGYLSEGGLIRVGVFRASRSRSSS